MTLLVKVSQANTLTTRTLQP